MKFDKNKAFPYPVLRPQSDDYKDAEFQANAYFTIGKEKIKVNIEYAISSEEILDEIDKGNAEFISIISCRDTYFQRALPSSEKEIVAEFDAGELRGEVRVNPYVVVKKEISAFTSPDINSEFGIDPIKFVVGDLMAQDDAQVFYIDRELFKPITTVFDLVKKDGQSDDVWTIGFEENHIQIEVSTKMKQSIDDARNNQKNRIVLLNSILFATVMQAVQKLKDSRGDYAERKWAQVILQQAHNKDCDIDQHDAYLIAERLMQHPIKLLDTVFKGMES